MDDAHDAAADVTATLDILGVYTSRRETRKGLPETWYRKRRRRVNTSRYNMEQEKQHAAEQIPETITFRTADRMTYGALVTTGTN